MSLINKFLIKQVLKQGSKCAPKDIRHEYNEHMAFYKITFWIDPNKAKEENQRRNKSSGFQRNNNNGQRVRTCYN
jgi:hypothetical protein